MCWNLDEEKMSRAAAFITDCSRDWRYGETPASVELPYSPAARGLETTPTTEKQISTLTDV